jgi:hypothetical protein
MFSLITIIDIKFYINGRNKLLSKAFQRYTKEEQVKSYFMAVVLGANDNDNDRVEPHPLRLRLTNFIVGLCRFQRLVISPLLNFNI